LAVCQVRVSELLVHPTLLQPKFADEGHRRDRNGEYSSPFAYGYSGANNCEKKSRVDWMTNNGVRTRCDELVPFLDGNGSTPV
jgi:hypothetical protein